MKNRDSKEMTTARAGRVKEYFVRIMSAGLILLVTAVPACARAERASYVGDASITYTVETGYRDTLLSVCPIDGQRGQATISACWDVYIDGVMVMTARGAFDCPLAANGRYDVTFVCSGPADGEWTASPGIRLDMDAHLRLSMNGSDTDREK